MTENKSEKFGDEDEKTIQHKLGELFLEAMTQIEQQKAKEIASGHVWTDPEEDDQPDSPQEWVELGVELGRESAIDELLQN